MGTQELAPFLVPLLMWSLGTWTVTGSSFPFCNFSFWLVSLVFLDHGGILFFFCLKKKNLFCHGLFVCVCVHMSVGPPEARRGYEIRWCRGYRWF